MIFQNISRALAHIQSINGRPYLILLTRAHLQDVQHFILTHAVHVVHESSTDRILGLELVLTENHSAIIYTRWGEACRFVLQ